MSYSLRKFTFKYRKWLQGTFGILLLVMVIWRSQPAQLIDHLLKAPLTFLIPWLVFYYFITIFTWGAGIHPFFKRIQPGGWREVLGASFKLQVLSVVVPGRLGDLGLLYFLRQRYTLSQSSAVLIVDKLITLAINLILACWGVAAIFSFKAATLLALLAGGGLAAIFWFFLKCPQGVIRFKLLENLLVQFQGFRSELRNCLADRKAMTVNLLLTCFRYLLAGISMRLLLHWFGAGQSLWLVILIQSLCQLVSFVPLTTMGLGIQEATNVYLFGLHGVPAAVILAVGLWARAVYLAFLAFTYLFWMSRMKDRPPTTTRSEKA